MRLVRIAPIILLILTPCAWAGWQIECSDTLVQEMARAGGSFSSGSGETQEPVWGQDGYGIPIYNMIRNARQEAAERRMQTARGLNNKGLEQAAKGNWAAAAHFYREALKVAPNDPIIQQNLKNAEAREKARWLSLKGIATPQNLDWAAGGEDSLYFLAGRTLYRWQIDNVAIIGTGLGDMTRWQDGTLYILDTKRQSLLKLENLPKPEGMPQEMP